MFLQIFHLNGCVKYTGWIKGFPRWLKRDQKIFDIDGLMLSLFEKRTVICYNDKGNKIDQGIVKNSKITKEIIKNDLLFNHESNDDLSDDESNDDESDDDTSDDDSSYDDDDSSYDEVYDGEMFNGKRNGKGILKKNGYVEYIGEFLDGEKNGKGVTFFEKNKIHVGEYLNGTYHGFGKYFNPNSKQIIFEGEFKKGTPFNGKIFYQNKLKYLKYQGPFKNYKGEFVLLNSEHLYIGNVENGERNGHGISADFDGEESYKGEWKNNKYHGKGTLFNGIDDIIYEGEWKNGMKDGYGTFYDDYEKYVGEFKDDKKEGYGITYTRGRGVWEKTYSGFWKNDEEEGDGLCYFNGLLSYDGEMKDGYGDGYGIRYYPNGNIQYEGIFKEHNYHLNGRLFYIDGTICFEGLFKKGNPYWGTFYDNDGTVHKTQIINGEYYTKGVLINEGTEEIYFRGEFKNGLFHGEGISENYVGTYKEGKYHGNGTYYNGRIKEYTGQFINGFFWDGKKLFHIEEEQTIFEGSMKDDKYYTGIETLFENDNPIDEDGCLNEIIGYQKWNNGEIVNEKEERNTLRQKMLISSFLETKNKKILNKIYKKDYLRYLKETYNISNVENKTKKQLFQIIERKNNEKKNQNEPTRLDLLENEPEQFDLFGNEIVNPVRGFDDEIYDESSMKYLFQRNDENEFVNISYIYDENDKKIPNYPIMTNGKMLKGYTKGKIQIYEYPNFRFEMKENKDITCICKSGNIIL